MAGAASILFIISAVLDLLVAISIPFFPTTNLFIVGINFSNDTDVAASTTLFGSNNGTVFNGQINSENVQNLTDLHVS